MIIDCHAHVAAEGMLPTAFFESWTDNLARSLPTGGRDGLRRLFCQLNHDPYCDRLIAEMDAAGIDKTVLLIIDFGLTFSREVMPLELAYQRHRELLERYSDRFLVFGGIDARRGSAALELFERSIREWNFRGLKLYPPCGYSPSDRSLFP
jgi:predicted TIM-barrel fold metal-dependent hydrolase